MMRILTECDAKAGVDMATHEPFRKTMAVMNHIMEEIETILARREGW